MSLLSVDLICTKKYTLEKRKVQWGGGGGVGCMVQCKVSQDRVASVIQIPEKSYHRLYFGLKTETQPQALKAEMTLPNLQQNRSKGAGRRDFS